MHVRTALQTACKANIKGQMNMHYVHLFFLQQNDNKPWSIN